MQQSNSLLAVPAADAPIYVYVHSETTRNRVLRLLPLRNDEPFHGLSSRFLFIGYAAHDYQLSPIYWPEEYREFVEPAHNIIRQIGFLASDHNFARFSIYEIEAGSSGFLEDIRPPFCGPSPQGLLYPIWVLERLNGIPFNPAQFPNGFLPPAPVPVAFPAQASWNAFDPFVQQPFSFSNTLLPLSMDFDNDRTVDLTVASTADDMFEPPVDDNSSFSNTVADGADIPHEELHWRLTFRDDSLDCSQKRSLKLTLLTSPWGRPIKLAKYLYVGQILVGMPANPFSMREVDCRRLITASFLKALHVHLTTYEKLREIPLTVANIIGSETRVYWSQLRNRFLDYPIDFTSELRKIVRGGTTPDAGFGKNTEEEAEIKLHIIDLMNSDNESMIQEAICKLIVTQGFRELLWVALYRPIADLPEGQARLADFYPEAIQTLTGYLGKGIVGVLVTLMYQSFIPPHAEKVHLKTLEVYPHITAALDMMYANPHHFISFFDAARRLPHIREENVLYIDPKSRQPRIIVDPVTNEKRMKVMDDIEDIIVEPPHDELAVPYAQYRLPHSFKSENMTTSVPLQSATLSDRGIGIWPTQLPRYAEVVLLTDDAYEDNLVRGKEISDPPPLVYGDWQELVHPIGGTYFYNLRKNAFTLTNLRNFQNLQTLDEFVNASRAAAKEDSWILVVEPIIFMGEERFQYYYVVPGSRIIAWLEDLDGYILFQPCVKSSTWKHKRLELEAQYWKHFEYFPHQFRLSRLEVRRIRGEMVCYLGEATTLKQSTAASIFWTLEEMDQIIGQLAYVEEIAENDLVPETGIVLCCRIMYMLRHHQYLHRYNQPEARLIRTHAVRERHTKFKLLHFVGNTAATMLCMPITFSRVRSTSVDGIVNGVEVQSFIDDFGSQTRNQITLAGISMALDVAILAVPGLGATTTAQTLCSCSFLLGVGCIFAGTIVHHFGERLKSLDFAAYYLRRKAVMLLVITSIPTCFCVLSVTSSILGFLTGITIDFRPSAPSVIACFATLAVVNILDVLTETSTSDCNCQGNFSLYGIAIAARLPR
ncbi:uncharacterized protein HD556DRAFT_1442014 [Suillus plorans]|uniref:Uncharacterized protein n=1 Tax=Suillus plorans TaxID=116603 RepID=A0A9P7AVN5_9AGAM|nr:uncharacterized protein HD556DRAFT_1442014 [Suillus plorans]KAG1795688.1 hypothetical protein HD556DRAFT_1442014 [Suillus plorans]